MLCCRIQYHLLTCEYPEPPFDSQMASEDKLSSVIRHAQKEVFGRTLPKIQHMARRMGAEESNSRGCAL